MRQKYFRLFTIVLFLITAIAFIMPSFAIEGVLKDKGEDLMRDKPDDYPVATLAGGCFWCLESEFRALDGILYTRVGYIGGKTEHPTYEDITTGRTGHAEAVEITYDPDQISFNDLVTFFFTKAHDPTQLNRQGVDVGTQYRSHIFYHSDEQKDIAHRVMEEVNAGSYYTKPIVTQISPIDIFWTAEDYHQQYYEKYEEQRGIVHPRVVYKKRIKALKGE